VQPDPDVRSGQCRPAACGHHGNDVPVGLQPAHRGGQPIAPGDGAIDIEPAI
jgi:hypothetical protein